MTNGVAMLGQFLKGALAAAFCIGVALACTIPLGRWPMATARDWALGLGVIVVASMAVGALTAACWRLSPQDRLGRRRGADPTDVIPFL